jgi:hypothetical protein
MAARLSVTLDAASQIVSLEAQMTKHRRRSLALVAAIAVVTAMSPVGTTAFAATSSSCRIHVLAAPAGATSSHVAAGDEAGHWLAGMVDTSIIRWHDGERSIISSPYSQTRVSGVTASGLVAATGSNGVDHAFVIDQATRTELTANGKATSTNGINEAGQVAGTVADGDFTSTAVVWEIDRPASPTVIEPAGAASSFAEGINARGAVAINAVFDEGMKAFVVREGGRPRPLSPATPGAETRVTAISGHWAAGWEYAPDTGEKTLLRWNLRNRQEPDAIPSAQITPTAISPTGVIGGVLTADNSPILVIGHTLVPLPPLADGFTAVPTTIDRHMVAAGGALTAQQTKAVTWTCR